MPNAEGNRKPPTSGPSGAKAAASTRLEQRAEGYLRELGSLFPAQPRPFDQDDRRKLSDAAKRLPKALRTHPNDAE